MSIPKGLVGLIVFFYCLELKGVRGRGKGEKIIKDGQAIKLVITERNI